MDPNEQPNNPNEPRIIKPEDMFQPTVQPGRPEPPPQPSAQPAQNTAPLSGGNDDPEKKKRIIIVAAAGVGAIILILIIVVILSSGGGKPDSNNNQNNQSGGILNEPTALDIENANNSISSDITSLNDDNDFPQSNLTDINLHL
ncbi:MAG TPA: hypothetical protein VFW77_03830 [Candidatus Saccharimonadales bacterium]|nr:hypothetical protein [Candidatus Saccharimonadales bacterium]